MKLRDWIYLAVLLITVYSSVTLLTSIPKNEIEKLVKEKAELEQRLSLYEKHLDECHKTNEDYAKLYERLVGND